MTMKTAWRMLGLDWTRLISDCFGLSGYHFPLYSSKLCVDHTPVTLYTETGNWSEKGLLFSDAFGALYTTLSLIAWSGYALGFTRICIQILSFPLT